MYENAMLTNRDSANKMPDVDVDVIYTYRVFRVYVFGVALNLEDQKFISYRTHALLLKFK